MNISMNLQRFNINALDGGVRTVVASRACQNLAFVMREREITVRRKRYQKGSISIIEYRGRKAFLAQWREDGRKRTKILGPISMGQIAAENQLAEIVRPINLGVAAAQPTTFTQFVRDVYLPTRHWKNSTRGTSMNLIEHHLLRAFGQRQLQSISRKELFDFLDAKAEDSSSSLVGHLCSFLKTIFAFALADGAVSTNPAAVLTTVPGRCKPGRYLRSLTAEEVEIYLSALGFREQLIARLAIFSGMRPGEIFGLRWADIEADIAHIVRRVYRREFDRPKNGKSRDIAISPETMPLLEEWRELARDKRDLVFPSETGTTPLSRDNLWRRNMEPKLKPLGLGWATFQALRKTNASLMHKYKVDPKVGADQRGHGLRTSLEEYVTTDPDQKRAAVQAIEAAVKAAAAQVKRVEGVQGIAQWAAAS